MIVKATIIHFTALILIAVLPVTSDSLAFEQGARTASERQSTEDARQAEALFENALLLSAKQQSEPARLQLQEAMRIWVRKREPGKAVRAALQMGDRYKQARNYQYALYYYRLALDVKSAPGAARASALNAIALVYSELYLHDLASRYFNRALEQARIIKDSSAQTLALSGLSELYHQQGAKEKALECITRALRISNSGRAAADPALLYLKGRLSQDQGLVEQASRAFEEALAAYEDNGNTAGQVRVLCALSGLSLLASRKQDALGQAEQAVKVAEEQRKRAISRADHVRARELRWPAWLSRARAERALGRKKLALNSYKLALGHFAGVWWAVKIATEAGAVAFREEIQAAYREYVDLLMERGEYERAFKLADEAKARVTLNLITARRAARTPAGEVQEAALRELDRSLARLRAQQLYSDLTPEQQARLEKEIEDAEFKMHEAQAQAELARYKDRLVWSDLAAAELLREQMARDQMALAEFCLGEDRSFVWLVTEAGLFYEILPPRKEIEGAVRAYLNILAVPPDHLLLKRDLARLRAQSGALFTRLFGRLAGHVKPGRQLIVVPDGLLHYLPFETLIRDDRYLIEDTEISYSPSASMLGLWQDSKSPVGSGDKLELLAVGDPVFESKVVGRRRSKAGSPGPARQALDARGFRLTPLPNTRDEVQYIAGLFPDDRRRVFLGSEGTEAAIKREPLRRFRRLHFATHSLIDEESPSRSAVALSLDADVEEDGYLDVGEIARLSLDSDLVVVSACQTGRGKLLSGEGILGLSRAFLHAGARSVVVSLWKVSDISTGRLMKSFYQNMAGGLSSAAALRRAKVQMIGGGQTSHPYYWSSFVMVGKP